MVGLFVEAQACPPPFVDPIEHGSARWSLVLHFALGHIHFALCRVATLPCTKRIGNFVGSWCSDILWVGPSNCCSINRFTKAARSSSSELFTVLEAILNQWFAKLMNRDAYLN